MYYPPLAFAGHSHEPYFIHVSHGLLRERKGSDSNNELAHIFFEIELVGIKYPNILY